jgi:hypothetical protein
MSFLSKFIVVGLFSGLYEKKGVFTVVPLVTSLSTIEVPVKECTRPSLFSIFPPRHSVAHTRAQCV